MVLLLLATEARKAGRVASGGLLLAGLFAPWLSATALFVVAAIWLGLAGLTWRARTTLLRSFAALSVLWGLSNGLAYLWTYRGAAQSGYMHRFWGAAFLSPAQPDFLFRCWRAAERLVWGTLIGDPELNHRPFDSALIVLTMLGVALVILGVVHVLRTRGPYACWCAAGPVGLTLGASALGFFPFAPRLMLFALPLLLILAAGGLRESFEYLGAPLRRYAYPVIGTSVMLGFEFLAVARAFTLPPSSEFPGLVREWRAQRKPGEPLYIFARTLPAWIYYTTDWQHPDTLRLQLFTRLASAGSPAFENLASRAAVRPDDGRSLVYVSNGLTELVGLGSGMEWREGVGNLYRAPRDGWAEVETDRVAAAAAPGAWVIASTWYAPETRLFTMLERRAVRRTFADLRHSSALIRLEFAGE